jgi:glycosyltransferase involved in cell wall biosynthesis
MDENKIKICFVNGANPNFLGGISLYQKNLINYLKSKNKKVEITWIYKSNKKEAYVKDAVNYIGLNTKNIPFIEEFIFNKKAKRYLNENYFDIINSHAIWGYWMNNYKRKGKQILINTYHGATLPYYKIHLKRFGLIKRIFLSPILFYSYLIEKPPIKKADKIICVSEKVKKQIEEVYGNRKNVQVIRTGVDLSDFKPRNKESVKNKFKLDKNIHYGLCVGRGGYWIKGLDRAIKISEEIYKLNKDFRLLVIGSDKNKVKELLKKEFIIYKEQVPREQISSYYNACDCLFALSRYEGGAPTLVVSEGMASGCLVLCSKDSEQEIIQNRKNGLILERFDKAEAKEILNLIKNKKIKNEIIKNSIKTIKDISIEKWGEKYSKLLGI